MESATTYNDAGTAQQAQEKVSGVADQAKEQAGNLATQAQDRARSELDHRSTEAGERVLTTADDVRSVSDELRNQGKDGPAKLAEQAADRVERAGDYLRKATPTASFTTPRTSAASVPGPYSPGVSCWDWLQRDSSRRPATVAIPLRREDPSRRERTAPAGRGSPDGRSKHSTSSGQLIKQLPEETSTLVRQEIELAKAELSEKGKAAGIGAGFLGGAGLIGVLALALFTAALVLLWPRR